MIKKLLIGLAVICMSSISYSQVTIEWYNAGDVSAIGPDGNPVMSGSDYTSGALFQLIQAAGGVVHTPTAADFGTGTGVTGGDTMHGWAFANSGLGSGLMYRNETYNSLTLADSVYVRIWTLPSSGSGNLNSAPAGMYYYDTAAVVLSSLPGTVLKTYEFTPPTQSDWTFLAVPEPGTIALGLLGLGALITRRFLRK